MTAQNVSGMRTFMRTMLAVSLASIFAAVPLPSIAQQLTAQQVVDAEAEHKAVFVTYQGDALVEQRDYYLWRGNCYVRHQMGEYEAVPLGYCEKP
jgi:hypothetical protein